MEASKLKKLSVQHSAQERAQAVLSIWSERRRPRELIKEMSINANVLSQWQSKAMSAMLKALEPRDKEQQKGPALSPRLEKLLARKVGQINKMGKLANRLEKIQQQKPVK
jgi:transposase-like protein